MKNNYKNLGIVLIILAIIVFIGLVTHWTFKTWEIIDWIIIIACGYIGLVLYNN